VIGIQVLTTTWGRAAKIFERNASIRPYYSIDTRCYFRKRHGLGFQLRVWQIWLARMSCRCLKIKELESLAKKAEFQPGKLANLRRISTRQMQRIFQRDLHKTPSVWLRQLQCRLAKELISKGFSNKAITADLGFASETHFCREFKKVFKSSPKVLQQALKHVANGL